jgi:anaerobic selenocysteine-containing dehydrogenase
MERFARMYASAKRAVLIWSMGITQHEHGVENVHAIVNLGLARGFVAAAHGALDVRDEAPCPAQAALVPSRLEDRNRRVRRREKSFGTAARVAEDEDVRELEARPGLGAAIAVGRAASAAAASTSSARRRSPKPRS